MNTTVLDHGYIKLVESWGSDESIICAARMSTDKGFKGWGDDTTPGDEKLLTYLYTHAHMSPFEFAGAVFEVQAPIFVLREWMRSRTQSYNEMSARYTPLPNANYMPTLDRLMTSGGANKQATSTWATLNISDADTFIALLDTQYRACEHLYQQALRNGVPKELARIILPVGRYSRMRTHANLRNWLQFLTLRQDPNAQYEIREYANAINAQLITLFPRTMALFNEGK